MAGLFDGTPLERPVTCERCERPRAECTCPRNAAGELTLPKDQQVRVRREKRRGKTVTVIAGLDPAANDLAALAKAFQSRLGAGGTVKAATIELQGDHRDAVLTELKQRGFAAKPAGG
jgi:translation initiation factor 1